MAWLDSELERLSAPDYLNGLAERTLEDVRAMRAECQQAETAVSYLRRVAQGRLDIVHTYIEGAKAGGEGSDLSALVENLSSIIGAGPPRPSGPGRLPSQMSPDMEAHDLTAGIDAVLDAAAIGELPSMGEAQLRAIAEQLIEIEARISEQRRSLHERIDALQGEIVSRYKSGQVSPDGLLA
ncbi:MAG: RsiG family protein [Acidimicrobiales bacterium]